MARQLRDLHELAVRRPAGNPQTVLDQRPLVQAVELVAVAMALVNEVGSVHALRQRTGRDLARVGAKPHRAAKRVDSEQIAQLVDHFRRRVGAALG